jgi:hypothetical protein
MASALAVLASLTVRGRFNDPDMWWHLKTGEVIWTTHKIPTTDLFSYTTHHHAWVPHEWLSQVTIYGAYHLCGYTGLMVWFCCLASMLLIAGYALCSLYSGNAKVAFLGAILVWFFSTMGLAIRPQLIGYLLLILELILVHLGRTRSPRWFYGLPVLLAVWVNCHASFFLGLLVLGVFLGCSFFDFEKGSLAAERWSGERRKALVIASVLSAAAVFLNPVGVRQVLYPLNTLFGQHLVVSKIEEWEPLLLSDPRGIALLGILACIGLWVMAQRSEKLYLHEIVLLAMGTWMGLSHRRLVFAFGILAAPVVSRLLRTSWEGYEADKDKPLPNAIFLALALAVLVLVFPGRANLAQQVEAGNPAKAVAYIKEHSLSGNMMNTFTDGGYLIWALPEHPVFIDGRADVYEWTGVMAEFGRWATLETDPNALLNKYDVSFCLLDRDSAIAHAMLLLPGWKQVYSDNASVIFVRENH